MKQILLLILATLLATTDALAADKTFEYTYEGKTLNYRVLDEEAKTCEVDNSSRTLNNGFIGKVLIPSTASDDTNEYTVVGITSHAFWGLWGLNSIEIPNTVTYIGSYAFSGSGLREITLGSAVETIGSNAFDGCSTLKEITLGCNVKTIGAEAFRGCTGLLSVTLLSTEAPSIDPSTFDSYNYSVTTLNIPEFTLEQYLQTEWSRFSNIVDAIVYRNLIVTDGVFQYKVLNFREAALIAADYTSLTEAFIPERFVDETDPDNPVRYTIVEVEKEAFKDCKNLKLLKFNSNSKVTKIDENTFSGCTNLTSVFIGNSVKTISKSAFMNCSALTDVTLGNALMSINQYAFSGCSSLESISIPASVTFIDNFAFNNCSKLKKIDFESIEALCKIDFNGNWLGYDCNHDLYIAGEIVTDLVIPETVESIGTYCFMGCNGLKSVTIPESVKSIKMGAFAQSGIESISLPESISEIEGYTFYQCSKLAELTIPRSVTRIGSRVFDGCSALTAFRMLGAAPDAYDDTFYESTSRSYPLYKNATLYIPKFEYSYFKSYWEKFENVISGGKAASVKSDDNLNYMVLDDAETPEAGVMGLANTSLSELEVPRYAVINDGENTKTYKVVDMAASAFSNRSSLTSVTISAAIKDIKTNTFYGCSSLESISIPNSVNYIGKYAFFNCTSLKSAVIPKSGNSDSDKSFYSSSNLASETVDNSEKIIDYRAFKNCTSLATIDIPGSITAIGEEAFVFCESLDSIVIPNSVTSIGRISFGECKGLTSVVLPNSLTNIEVGAFSGCSSLTSIIIPNSVESIGSNAFGGCSYLSSLTLPNSVATISSSAFGGCALEEVVLPPSVETVEDGAFSGNANLKAVIMGHNVSSIGENAFKNCPVDNVYCTALNPPTAPNTAFTRYSGKLSVANEQTIDTYYDALSCWDRFDTYAAMVEPTALLVDGDPYLTGNVGDTFRLSATIEPADVTLPHIFWRSTNPAVATVDTDGVVMIRSDEPQECQIIAESLYADGPMCSVTINPGLSAIEAIGADNPAAAQIDFSQPFAVYNLQGMRLSDSLTNLAPGLYIIRQGAAAAKHLIR